MTWRVSSLNPTALPGSFLLADIEPSSSSDASTSPSPSSLASAPLQTLQREISRVILGQEGVVEQAIITLIAGGHALLEGVPGTAKTLTVRTLAKLLDCRVKRIQFTPDLMPADIIGTNIYNLNTNAFELRQGPIFTDLLVADEINRAPAKTQSALLEAMSEAHATIAGQRHSLSPIFTVFATQNPVEFEGTYPLPEAQQDRFLMKIPLDYPPLEAERQVLMTLHEGRPPELIMEDSLKPVMTIDDLLSLRKRLKEVRVEPGVADYILKITRATRGHELLAMGAGPRGSMYLLQAAKSRALYHGRDYISPDDVVAMVTPVLSHRIALSAEAEVSGEKPAGVLQAILSQIEVPR